MDGSVADRASSGAHSERQDVRDITERISSLSISEPKQVESDGAHVSPKTSDCEMKASRWLKVRDSLEGISQQTRGEESLYDPPEKFIKSKSLLSDSVLVFKKPTKHIHFSKIFMWDPWNKIGRKNKKEKLRKKNEELLLKLEHRNRSEGPSPILRKSSRTEKEEDGYLNTVQRNISPSPEHQNVALSREDFSEKFHKSVRFQKEVNVVYFAGDQILEHKTEPLKKETEQQERNKELRREVSAETVSGIKFVLRKSQSDYTPGWHKK